MKDLAPGITRQRLLMEGFSGVPVDRSLIETYFKNITEVLNLRMYGQPIIFSPGGEGKEANQGYDAFVPLIDSGISLYYWSTEKFLSIIIYTCKGFDNNRALKTTKTFFTIENIEFRQF
ncbi:S-adenosylmethionine decarboxylase [Aestuariivivens sediminicola]|uniref:S-adenosylmethionine decarboxylase n=1 Tax=Aestuariivivens sediminicola TaxID=2913560 RepID=UPI001F583F35|nr:S-adenosylmethionine decarboxylase [Aestuariivivens sediminicola]